MILAGALALHAWGVLQGYVPRFDLVMTMSAPTEGGRAEAYFNGDGTDPHPQDIRAGSTARYVFAGVPDRLEHLRIDPVNEAGVAFRISDLRIVTSAGYAPAPNQPVYVFHVDDWPQWTLRDIERTAAGDLRSTSRDPMLLSAPGLDLAGHLAERAAAPLAWRVALWLALALAAAGGALAAGGTIALRRRDAAAFDRLVLASACVLGAALTVASSYPGHTNYDEFSSLNEILSDAVSDIQPPLQAIAWAGLIDLGKRLGLGNTASLATMLIVQTALFWWALYVIAGSLRTRWLGAGLVLAFAALPPTLAYLGHIGKDTQHAVALAVALALILAAWRRRARWPLVVAVLPLFYAFGVRSNGLFAVLPLCVPWAVAWFEARGTSAVRHWRVGIASLGLFAALFAANAGFYEAVVRNKCCLGNAGYMTLVHDMMGISYRIDENLVPPYMYSVPDYSLDTIRRNYEPRWTINFDGLRIIRDEDQPKILRDWLDAVTGHPREYLGHRLDLARYFLGLTTEPNHFGLFLGFYRSADVRRLDVNPELSALVAGVDDNRVLVRVKQAFATYFWAFRDTVLFRPWFYVVVAGLAYLLLGRSRGAFPDRLTVWLGLSNALYFLPYLPLTSSASFRYVIWSLFATLLAVAMRADATLAAPGDAADDPPNPVRRAMRRLLPAGATGPDGRFGRTGLPVDVVLYVVSVLAACAAIQLAVRLSA